MVERMKKLLVLLCMVFAAGCAAPLTADMVLAQATTLGRTCADLLTRDRISADAGVRCMETSNVARAAAESARTANDASSLAVVDAALKSLLLTLPRGE